MSMVDLAYASFGAPAGGGSGWEFFPFLAAMIAIFYFLIIRPQQRQRRERENLLRAVKKGDRVVTTSGLHGTIVGLSEHTVTLKVADQVKLDFDRAAIGRIVPAGGEKDTGA
jgi:preprotein translocase subunit YajC